MQDLVAETYRATGKQIAAILDEALAAAGPSAEARLHAFIETSFRPPLLDADLLAVWLAFWSMTRTDPEIHAIHAKVYAGYRRLLEGMIAELAKENRVALETRQAALALTALLDGLWLEHCLDPRPSAAPRQPPSPIAGWMASRKAGSYSVHSA